jgi:hypothetical protein
MFRAQILIERILITVVAGGLIALAVFLKLKGWQMAWPFLSNETDRLDTEALIYILVAWIPLLMLGVLKGLLENISARWKHH